MIQEDTWKSIPAKPGLAQRRGVRYEVANGETIENKGEKFIVGETAEGHVRSITAQVCEVNRDLLSVHRMTQNGQRVVFDEDGSFIDDKVTGHRTWMQENGGMFTLTMWVKNLGF